MDKEFLVGCIAAVTALAIIVAGIVSYSVFTGKQELDFSKACFAIHKGVVYENISGSLVSECK